PAASAPGRLTPRRGLGAGNRRRPGETFRPRPKHRREARPGQGASIATMNESVQIAEIAALVGDPARANIISALMDGRALTAGELAYAAGVSPQTTSGHLAKLTAARLLVPQKQGRHRYYRLATPAVGRMIEGIM